MGDVVGLIQIMPSDVLEDDQLAKILDEIKEIVKPPAKISNVEIKNVAFGLRGINLTIIIPDKIGGGGFDPIAEQISKLKNVESAEVTDVGLL